VSGEWGGLKFGFWIFKLTKFVKLSYCLDG